MRIQTVQSLEEEAVRQQSAMRVYLRDDSPLASLSRHLNSSGDGIVSFVVIQNEGLREVEVELPGKYRLSPEVASAMRAVSGVVDVELV